MSRFLKTYLPAEERRDALWLAFGAAGVAWLGSWVAGAVMRAFDELDEPLPTTSESLVLALVVFAGAYFAVWALIRFAHAPRALALAVIGAQLAVATMAFATMAALRGAEAFIGIQGGSGSYGILTALSIAAGAFAGAWAVDKVTVDKIRHAGLGDEDDDRFVGEGHDMREATGRWGFLGIEGHPVEGGALIAFALTLYTAVTYGLGVLQTVLQFLALILESGSGPAEAVAVMVVISGAVLYLAGVTAGGYIATLRTGVRSIWLATAAVVLYDGLDAVLFIPEQAAAGGVQGILVQLVWLPVAPIAIGATVLGTMLALKRRAARIAASDSQNPGAATPDDTAGGTR